MMVDACIWAWWLASKRRILTVLTWILEQLTPVFWPACQMEGDSLATPLKRNHRAIRTRVAGIRRKKS